MGVISSQIKSERTNKLNLDYHLSALALLDLKLQYNLTEIYVVTVWSVEH